MPNDTYTEPTAAARAGTQPAARPRLVVEDCGTVAYRPMWARQQAIVDAMVARRRAGLPVDEERLLLVEHPHVYTLGRHGHADNMLLSERALQASGAECVRVDRGGDITYHGPGQLVAYPIISLEAHRLGVKAYVDLLEESVIRTIAAYGIRGGRVEGATGVWLGIGTPRERKICAIGVRCQRFITEHGLALNVNTDLGRFRAINPCGFVDKGVTSLQAELGREVSMGEVKRRFTEEFTTLLP